MSMKQAMDRLYAAQCEYNNARHDLKVQAINHLRDFVLRGGIDNETAIAISAACPRVRMAVVGFEREHSRKAKAFVNAG